MECAAAVSAIFWLPALLDAEAEIFRSGRDPFHRYLAWDADRPVAACMTSTRDGVAALQTLCTLPTHRNRGIGAALATHALTGERNRGCVAAVVWSAPKAQTLYRRMGFRPCCDGHVLML